MFRLNLAVIPGGSLYAFKIVWGFFLRSKPISTISPLESLRRNWMQNCSASSSSILPILLPRKRTTLDRKSTRLNSSHVKTSYAVFCLKNKDDEGPTPE